MVVGEVQVEGEDKVGVEGWSEESRVAKCNAKLAEKISLVGQHAGLWGLGTIGEALRGRSTKWRRDQLDPWPGWKTT